MQYLLMCCFNEDRWAQLPESQREKIMQEYAEFDQSIVKSGHFRAKAQLQSISASTTVRHQNGKPVITDGPFAETKEQLGGYHLVECRDLDEALSIAARIPTLPYGGLIEVRPLVPATATIGHEKYA
ncbi:MAG TPA: YciI family protein [Candidatus Eisenbacteria bacterium]|nr:YciI family protein [Candidatus Eisenbacteria bacterium]